MLACFCTGFANARVLTWNGGGDGFTWGDEQNWQNDMGQAPGAPPGASDDVEIPSMSQVEFNGPAEAAAIQVSDALLIVNSSLSLSDSATIDRLRLSGDLLIADTIMIQGASEWKAGGSSDPPRLRIREP